MTDQQSFIGSLDKYRELFEEMEDIILIVNQKGVIEYVNRALRRHLGFKRKKFTNRNILDCSLFEPAMSRKEILQLMFSRREFLTQIKRSKVTNHYSWKTKTFLHNKQKKVIAVIRDTTVQLELQKKVHDYTKNLEELVYQRTRQLEKEKRKAIELHQTKALFLSRMSHELRTPLTAIRGYAELIRDDEELSQVNKKKYLSVIEKNSKHLLDMITETLQMVQIEQNKYQIQEKEFELKPFLRELMDTYTVLAKEKNISLECQLPDGMPTTMYSDPSAIRQILTNLIGNAIKFTEKGKIVLVIKERILKPVGKKLYFYIEDTGMGIPPEQHRRIFRSFEQYLDNQSIHSRGTGLGLPISRQLAKMLGGDVKLVSSEPFKGSIFVFTLTLRKAPSMLS